MARADDGEFELILGNKQLLSVFFVVVMLLGVFFAMGYIVGKNSIPAEAYLSKKTEAIRVDPQNPSGYRPAPVEPRPVPAQTSTGLEPRPSDAIPPVSRPIDTASTTPAPAVKPIEVRPEPRAAEAKPVEPPKTVVEPKREAAKKEEPRAARKEETKSAPVAEPSAGRSYLQVVASTRPDCEIIVDVLKRKGFSAIISPGPSDKLFRVLVGPLNDSAAISKTRAELEQAGFQKPYLRKQ
ncbi:MAG: SPOR domain-containing protein [Bryobacterales bacterium]|nr:SPOR domain-containing protein [Bryobacterales bacterium]